ncbi:MAG: oxidoreductase, partial [Actinobacteria bacterium]|nr:oxidoreductase [Actinomycetota bacterium]
MKVFVFDIEKCNGCYGCQIACKDEHAGNEWMPYAKPQPNTGQFWMRVKEKDHGQFPKVRVEYTPWP